MKTSELKAQLRARLAADAALEAFCRAHFDKSLTVFRTLDSNRPPEASDCPWAHLEFLGCFRSNTSNERRSLFQLCCGVWRDPDGDADDGEDLCADLRELIEAACMAPGLGKVETGEDVYENAEAGCFDNVSTIIITNK